MRFGELTEASARLRAQSDFQKRAAFPTHATQIEKLAEYYAPQLGMEKEAIVGLLLRAAPFLKNVGSKLVSGVTRAGVRGATAPARLPARAALNYAKKKPLTATFAALTGMEALGQGRQAYRQNLGAMQRIRQYGKAREYERRLARISPAHQLAPMSGF